MKSLLLLLLAFPLLSTTSLAWIALPTITTTTTRRVLPPSSRYCPRLFSSSSSEENVDQDVNLAVELETTSSSDSRTPISFDEAGKGLMDEEDAIRMEEAGDFDSNPSYSSDNIAAMREAIRKRTEEMGLEKSVVSKQLIQEASDRARAGGSSSSSSSASTSGVMGTPLDLTKIRGQIPEDMPTIMYDPEDEMTEEEKFEVDPIGQESWIQQAKSEFENSKWPSPTAALREVALMMVVVTITAFLIIAWDRFLRDFYTNQLHIIPTKAEIATRFEGLELPEGWTNLMTDDDVANLPSNMGSGAASSSSSSSGSGVSLPDL